MREMSYLLFVVFFVAQEASAQHISFLRAERISPNSLSSRVSVPFHSGVVVIDLPQNALRLPNYENQRRPRRLKSEATSSHRSRSFEMFSPPVLINEGKQTPWTPVTSESKLYRKRKSEKFEWPPEFNEISSPYGDPSDQYTLFVPAAAQTTRVNSINEQLPSYKPRASQPLPPAPVHNRRSNNQRPQMMIPFSMPVSNMKPVSRQSRPKPARPSSSVTGQSAGMSFEDMRLQELAPLFVPIESGPTGPRMQGPMKGHSEDLIPQDLLEQIISEIIPKIEAEERSRRQQSQESVAQTQKMKGNSPRPQLPTSSNDEGFPYLMNPDEGFNSSPNMVPKPRPFPSFKNNVQSFKMSKTNVPQPPTPQPPSKTSPAKPPAKGGYSPPPQQQVQQQEPQAKGYPQPAPPTKSAPAPQPPPPSPQLPRKGFTPMTPRPYMMPPPPPPMATKGGYAPPPPPPVKGPAPRPISKSLPPMPLSKTSPPKPSKSPPPPPIQQTFQEPEPQQPEQQPYQEPEPQQPVQQSYQEPERQQPVQQEQSYQQPQQPQQQYQEPEPQQPQQQEQSYQEPEPQQIEQQKEDQIPDEPQQQQEKVPEKKGRKPPAPKSRPPPPPVKGQRMEPVQVPQVQQEVYPTKSEQPQQRNEARKVPEVPPPPRKGSQSKKPLPRKPSPRPFLKPPPPTKAQPAPEERKRSRQVVTTPSTTTIFYDDSATYTAPEITTESGLSYTDVGFDDDAASDEFRESDMPSKMPLDDGEDEYNQTPAPRLASNSLREELKPRTVPPLRILPLSPANRARSSSPTRSASLRLASNNKNNEGEEEDDDDDDEGDDLLNDNRTPLADVTEAPDIVATTLSSLTVRPNSFMRARFQTEGNKNQQNSNLMFGDRLRSNNNNDNKSTGNRNIDEDNYDEIDDENEELSEDASSLSRRRRFEEFDSWEDETGKDDHLDSESSDKNLSVSPTASTPSSTSPVTSPITTTSKEVPTTTEKYELPISHHEARFRRFIVKPGRKVRLLDGSLNLESISTV